MAPTPSRLLPLLPPELVMDIAAYLSTADQHAMLVSCWTFHDIVAPMLYRSPEFWCHPSSWTTGSEKRDHQPLRLLGCLTASSRHISTGYLTRFYPRYVLTLAYVSFSFGVDLRAIPLLAEVFRFTHRLRHLRIEVDSHSVSLARDVFTRKGVIRSLTPAIAKGPAENHCTSLALPSLESVRSSKAEVVEFLMKFRGITTAIVDSPPTIAVLNNILAQHTSLAPAKLTRLSLALPVDVDLFPNTLRAIAANFPLLTELYLRTAAGAAQDTLAYLLSVLDVEPNTLVRLNAIGVNHGRLGLTYKEVLKSATAEVQRIGEDRGQLCTVVLGTSALRRVGEGTPWTLVHVRTFEWAWLSSRSRGAWELG